MEKNKYSKAILLIVASVIIYFAPRFLFILIAFILFVLGINELLKANGINVLETIKSDKFKEDVSSTINSVKDKGINLTNELAENTKNNNIIGLKKIVFAIIGAILGLPLSYYFQSDMLKMMVGGISGYIENFGDVLDESELISNVIISIVVFAVIGFFIGNYLDKNSNHKQI